MGELSVTFPELLLGADLKLGMKLAGFTLRIV